MERKLNRLWWVLRIGLGAIFLLSGTDKFFNLLTYWPMYMSETFARLSPLTPQQFMHVVGVAEMAMGLSILVGPVRVGAYAACLWMIGVAINLLTMGLYDLASRDLAISLGMYCLARLTEIVHVSSSSPRRHAAGSAYP